MVEIKINGNPYNFPTFVTELSLQQFFALREAKNIIDEICAVTGLDKQTVENFKSPKALQTAVTLMNVLAADIKKGFDGATLPKSVKIGDKTIMVPRDLHLEPIGAFMSVHDILAEQANKNNELKREPDFTDCIPSTLAHYFFTYVNPGAMYSDEAADAPEYLSLIMQLPFTVAVPIANFFFRKFPNLM